ncbi:MAG: hypothetical protein Q7S92_00620 [Candidatus Diapherotrites archaeon]|nr:hypothetical protein [Candidatus Diapherotrites archaeon]
MANTVTITLALNKEDEKLARKLAEKKYGGIKGSLSKVFSEGLHFVEHELQRQKARMRLIELNKQGFDLRFKSWKNRSELYDRN